MLDERARAEVLAIYIAELTDHCQNLSKVFLALEREPDEPDRGLLLAEAFRIAHSVKGAADAAGRPATAALAHGLEDTLADAKQERFALSAPAFDVLYAVVDAFGVLEDGVAADHASADPAASLLSRLQAIRAAQPRLDAVPAPSSADPGLQLAPSPTAKPARSLVGRGETIRLPAARLDQLLDELSELVIPRMEATEGLSAMAALRGDVEAWQREWRKARPLLRQIDRQGQPAGVGPLLRFLELNERNLMSLGPRLGTLHSKLGGATEQLASMTDRLLTDSKRFRMFEFGQHTAGFERVVRDLARSLGKEAQLVLEGADIELDRAVLEQLRDPLLHLLRNAVDHGLELPAERHLMGKPELGTVTVSASQRGTAIVIEVRDDGAGADVQALRQAAIDGGLASDVEVADMDDGQALRLMFLPDLSTSDEVNGVSGRGVGLDVVARNVEHLGGRIDVEAAPGRGTTFTITLPLTLTNTRAVLVEAGNAPYALPTTAVERVFMPEQIGAMGGRPTLEYNGSAIPVVVLGELLHLEAGQFHSSASPTPVALVGAGARRVALAVDRVIGEEEIVVKPLGFPLPRLRYFAGATILGSGRIVPILNARDLVEAGVAGRTTELRVHRTDPGRSRPRVLVVDDSLTTRTLERYILEAAGYDVALAANGIQALALLREDDFDVLVSDIDMPELNGIALTAKVREDPKLHELRVILVTALESPEDHERGLNAGADAYIVKSSFDQDTLLRTIEDLA
jgi:two-component system, chemotaxis family, sensor kinase CheA